MPRVEPDTILPDQFFAEFGGRSSLSGEKRLMLAIMEEAIECYQNYAFVRGEPRTGSKSKKVRTPEEIKRNADLRVHHDRAVFDEAEEWLFSSDNAWIYSFENICGVLDLNPDYLRRGLQEWRQRGIASRPRNPSGVDLPTLEG